MDTSGSNAIVGDNVTVSDDVSRFDQSAAFMGDSFPPLWRRLYEGCIAAGFTEEQALALVKVYIFSMAGKGIL